MNNKTINYIYILIGIIIVYYIIIRYFNYNKHEKFDTTIIPVSSLTTLAQVAQHIVNGNGTLTSPGNFSVQGNFTSNQITSNLYNANTFIFNNGQNNSSILTRILFNPQNTIFCSSNSGSNPSITNSPSGITSDTTSDINTPGAVTSDINTPGGIASDINTNGFIWKIYNGTQAAPYTNNIMTLDFNGNLTTAGNATIRGDLTANSATISGDTSVMGTLEVNRLMMKNDDWHITTDGASRFYFDINGNTYFGSGNGSYVFRTDANGEGDNNITINSSGLSISNINNDYSISTSGGIVLGGALFFPFNQYLNAQDINNIKFALNWIASQPDFPGYPSL